MQGIQHHPETTVVSIVTKATTSETIWIPAAILNVGSDTSGVFPGSRRRTPRDMTAMPETIESMWKDNATATSPPTRRRPRENRVATATMVMVIANTALMAACHTRARTNKASVSTFSDDLSLIHI